MRTIKASEVRKGMRVRVIDERRTGATVTTEGIVTDITGTSTHPRSIWFEQYGLHVPHDHPVTVLAEPEPEWVEGAWYWVELQEKRTLMRRVGRGWSALADTDYAFHKDANVTVLGRVLIVDWPGDDVARYLSTYILEDDGRSDRLRRASLKVADAIRTQGGAP